MHAFTAEQLFPHLERRLEAPFERSTGPSPRGRPSVRGLYAGRRTSISVEADTHDYVDDGSSFILVVMEGETYGLSCAATPMAGGDGVKTGDPTFDSAFHVHGAPKAVIVQLLGPGVRSAMLRSPSSVKFEAGRVVITFGFEPRTVESATEQLELGRTLLESLPAALRAAGVERFLALGSLATHPEMLELDATRRRNRATLVLLAVVLAVLLVLGGVGVALATCGSPDLAPSLISLEAIKRNRGASIVHPAGPAQRESRSGRC